MSDLFCMIVLKNCNKKRTVIWFFIRSNLQKNTCSGYCTPVRYFILINVLYCAKHFLIKELYICKKKKKIFSEFTMQKLTQMNFKISSTTTKKKKINVQRTYTCWHSIYAMLATVPEFIPAWTITTSLMVFLHLPEF